VGIKGTDIIPVIYNYVFSVSPPYFPEIPAFTRIKTAIKDYIVKINSSAIRQAEVLYSKS